MHSQDSQGPKHTIVIFGASGDLTQRKLVPALYELHRKKRLPSGTRVVGFARRPYSDEQFRTRLREGVVRAAGETMDQEAWETFAPSLRYFRGDLGEYAGYQNLASFLDELDGNSAHRLYYFATAPEFYAPTVGHLGAAGLAREDGAGRDIIVEKPFGRDLASARALNRALHRVFDEHQVYRIDHYLGKETAQNILFFRFANTIFEPIWNRRYVDSVEITVAEEVDVGHRAGYYDSAGVLRDMFQNHLLQLCALIAMEPPASFEADPLRNEKVKVLSAIRPITLADTVRAQYVDYRKAPGVSPESETPTYAALRLHIDNWRWRDVPFYLRSGKALAAQTSEVVIQFQCPPHVIFDLPMGYRLTSNRLCLSVQPDEGIHLKFETKVPDSTQETRSVDMQFHYRSSFRDQRLPDAYERLLTDALKRDASLFARSDEIEAAWGLIDRIALGWETPEAPPLATYPRGVWGPAEADDLLARDGRAWHNACALHEDQE